MQGKQLATLLDDGRLHNERKRNRRNHDTVLPESRVSLDDVDTSQTVAYRPNVVSKIDHTTKLRWPHNFGAYRLADHDLASGSLLGSRATQIRMKATGAIANVYCVAAGKSLIQTFVLKHWDERTGIKLEPVSGHYFLYPQHQEHKYMLSGSIYVSEHVFVGSLPPNAVYYTIEYSNVGEEAALLGTFAFCDLGIDVNDLIATAFDDEIGALTAYSTKNDRLARIVGADRAPVSYEVSLDRAMAVTPQYPGRLSGRADVSFAAAIAILQYSNLLQPGETARVTFQLCVGATGVDDLKKAYRSAPTAQDALTATQEHYHHRLAQTVVMTPNAEINRGVLWAKANMERVVTQTPQGYAFTNDPMNSTNCVGRDTAWFCVGADYFDPVFSHACLLQFLRRQERSGLIPEYFDTVSGKTEDFNLNINDDTPLIVWSSWHHYQMTRDETFLDEAYPHLVKACRYIASQRNGDGLVWCTSTETGTRGIAGWRNVIKNYRLSGAVTEVNAESYAAFMCMASLAGARGDESLQSEFLGLAAKLKSAINTHLRNRGNGLYYLNIDVDGTARNNITVDLLFPVLFGVADSETAAHVIRRLSDSDFWTPGGMRTIPHDAVDYTPDGASGCLGGVWNGATFWYAKAAAPYLPEFVEEALTNGFENYARNPQRNNTVPGQFSEWLHGQTLVNGGMLLSPWFPPRYLWAVVEGTFGIDVSSVPPSVEPHLPAHWSWSGVRNIPYQGKQLTCLYARTPELRLWSSLPVDGAFASTVLEEDMSDEVHCSGDDAVAGALRDGSRIVALVGNTTDRTVTTAVRFDGVRGQYAVRRYESMRGSWAVEEHRGAQLHNGLMLLLQPKGFELLELTQQ